MADREGTVRFLSDDWEGALALARAEGKPLFVDAWAPWCHSCVSMKAYVFPDPVLSALADTYVWLEIDTEKPSNRAFVERFPQEAWPMLMVVDSQTGQPVRRWLGSATAVELAARLRSTALALTPGAPGTPGQEALARASAAEAAGDHAAAAEALREALVSTRPGSLDHGQAAEALALRLSQDGQWAECLSLAREELGRVAPGTALATVVATGLSCALQLPETDPGRIAALTPFEDRVAVLAKDPSVVLLADGRSSLFETVVEARKARGDLAAAHAAAEAWSEFLEGQAQRAATAQERAVFDSHRLSAYLALGEPERAVPMLEQSAEDFPQDYNPPARLAVAYLAMREPSQALEEARVAERLVYGPRTLRVLLTKAEAEARTGDAHAARVTLARAEKLVDELPAAQRSEGMKGAIASKRKALFEPPTASRDAR
jgi:tetratricopeptide (TPR) repeat protein